MDLEMRVLHKRKEIESEKEEEGKKYEQKIKRDKDRKPPTKKRKTPY